MAWKYLDDFKNLEIGRRYKIRVMPDMREGMGILEEVRIDEGELNKGYVGLKTGGRFIIGEYQYIQYEEYDDNIATFNRVGGELIEALKKDFPNLFGEVK